MGNITIRMNDDLKARVNLPFDPSVRAAEPNEQTKRAMLEAEAKERGILPDDAATFNSAQDAITWLHNNHG